MARSVLALMVVAALFGCQSQAPVWTKSDATSADLRRDLADCEREGTGVPPYHFWALSESYEAARDRIARVKNECMKARGWQVIAR